MVISLRYLYRFRNKPTVDIKDQFFKENNILINSLNKNVLLNYKINISSNIYSLLLLLIFIMVY